MMRPQKKLPIPTDSNRGILLQTLPFDASYPVHLRKLKDIFLQTERLRPADWKEQIAALNAMRVGKAPALLTYIIGKISEKIPGKVDRNEIIFWNFLLSNGADPYLISIARENLMIFIVYKKNIDALRWYLEDCKFKITACEGSNNPITPGIPTHPLKHINFRENSAFNDYFFSQLHAHTPSHDTALILSIRYAQMPLLVWLIRFKEHNINAAAGNGLTPLMEAVKSSIEPAIEYLMALNADIASVTTAGLTAIHYAIWNANEPCLLKLVEGLKKQGKLASDIRDNQGLTLLHWAIKYKKTTLLVYLESLFTINETFLDPDGNNLAVFACAMNQPDIAERFIEQYQLSIYGKNSIGLSALFLSIIDSENSNKSIEWLIRNYSFNLLMRNILGDTPLIFAARIGNQSVVQYLVTKITGDLNAVNLQGNHVGHYLAEYNQSDMIQSLLKQNRLDLMHCNELGLTMLDIALNKGVSHYITVHACIEYFQAYNKKNQLKPLLPLTRIQSLSALLRFYCEDHLIQLDPWVENGQPPLHIACLKLPLSQIEELIMQFKLNVNQVNQHGQTALYGMITRGVHQPTLLKKARWFIETFKPKLSNLDLLGSSLLHLACEQQDLDLLEYCIEKRGLSLFKARKDHLTALDIALIRQHLPSVTYLWGRLSVAEQQSYVTQLNSKGEHQFIAYLTMNLLYESPRCKIEKENHSLDAGVKEDTPSSTSINSEPAFVLEAIASYPKCCDDNSTLKLRLHQLSDLVKNSPGIQAYIYGSFHFKAPNDVDILLPNITSIEAQNAALTLIYKVIEDSGVVTTINKQTREYGYKKHGVHIIPMEWRGIKLEWIITEKDYQTHAMGLDFTIGAQYFNLKTLQLHEIDNLHSRMDVHHKIINTILDPQRSFRDDPSRIFRAVRLIAEEGFHLSNPSELAIKGLFCNASNPLINGINPDKLNQQLTLLFKSSNPSLHIKILHELGVLNKLFECISMNLGQAARYYTEQLRPYCDYYYSIEELQTNTPPQSCIGQGPSFFYSPRMERIADSQQSSAKMTAFFS